MIISNVRRRLLTLCAGLGSVSLILGFTAGPAEAAPEAIKQPAPVYVGLGDSYAAGTGGGPVIKGPFLPAECLQTARAYPSLLGGSNLGCYGATTGDIAIIALGLSPVLSYASEVSITAGANDVGAGSVAAACTTAPVSQDCGMALLNVQTALLELPGAIKGLVIHIDSLAPQAEVVVTGYPRLFTITSDMSLEQRAVATVINRMTDQLNSAIQAGAAEAGIRYVDVASSFTGHGIGSATPWINYQPGVFNADTFHPNAVGYTNGYGPAVRSALKR
jgi:lysophospholipase L1-like esterase